jgi:hypothetical protein
MKRSLVLLPLVMVAACAMPSDPGPSGPGITVQQTDPALTVVRTPVKIHGALVEDGLDVRYQSEMVGKDVHVRVELNGMVLTAKFGKDESMELGGVNVEDAEPTLITELDRSAVRRLLTSLEAEIRPLVHTDHVQTKAEYDALMKLPTPAEHKLLRALSNFWAKWPTALPLQRVTSEEATRSWRSNRRHAASGKTVMGCHDCGSCDFDNLDMTNCCDSWALGTSGSGKTGLDAAFGNCGTSNWDTQFTWDCTNHDQCVRTYKHGGHAMLSLYCDDQFTSCVDDDSSAPTCNYDWRQNKNTTDMTWTYRTDCPTSWKGTGDGCDCFCQFDDPDCDSRSGITCNYHWNGTSYFNNCPLSWDTDGGCDCGCQFMDYDCYQ